MRQLFKGSGNKFQTTLAAFFTLSLSINPSRSLMTLLA
jgi:hypothetical protein